jgi:hypothetical protein
LIMQRASVSFGILSSVSQMPAVVFLHSLFKHMRSITIYHRIKTSLCEGLAPMSEAEFSRRIKLTQYLFKRICRK